MLELKIQLQGLGDADDHLDRMGRLAGPLLQRAMDDIALAMEGEARHQAPHKTGNLVRNITRTRTRRTAAGNFEASVGVQRTAPYGRFVHEGTGVYGVHHTPIRPTAGNVLRFKVAGKTLFRHSVRGQRANPFIRRTFVNVNATFVPARLERLKREIGDL